MSNSKVMLIILDGWGLSPNKEGNAPLLAKTPNLDFVYANYPKTSLSASGLEVGLSVGEPGNSEVGHLNIGSGRVVWENLPRIDQAIESGEIKANGTLKLAIENCLKQKSAMHFVGLVSDGGVHSHIRHLKSLISGAVESGVSNIYVHFISDGRDTAAAIADRYATDLENYFKELGTGRIVTLIGRYFAMDRDKNWDRQKKAFDLFTKGVGTNYPDVHAAIKANYDSKKNDENIEPSVIGESVTIAQGDSIVMFNHRSDRAKQLMGLFSGEEKAEVPADLCLVTMTEYENGQTIPAMFPPVNMSNTLPELIAASTLTQFHTAETEKFAHVTYFFNAGKETVYPKEKDEIVPSKKVPSYDQLPEMSALGVTGKVEQAINNESDFIVVNYANGDMVGHTGVLAAAVEACEYVDKCLGEVLALASGHGYKVFITADHGNCEVMISEETKEPNKEHTTNPVPFVYLDFTAKPFQPVQTTLPEEEYIQYAIGTPIGVLADVAPSILANLSLAQPQEMSGMDLSVAML